MLCSFALDLDEGFCSTRIGRTAAAFKAMHSRADLEANALYNLASSDTNDFPAFPQGTLKRFGFQ